MFFSLLKFNGASAFVSYSSPSPRIPFWTHQSPTSGFFLSVSSTPSSAPSRRSRIFGQVLVELQTEKSENRGPPPAPEPDDGGGGGFADRSMEDEGPGVSEISGIEVPRQRHISVSKSELLEAIVSTMFQSQEEIEQFLYLSSCLDSILHAEHKIILEKMRVDHDTGSKNSLNEDSISMEVEDISRKQKSDASANIRYAGENGEDMKPGESMPFWSSLNQITTFGSSFKTSRDKPLDSARVEVPSAFQRSFMQLLHNAGFEELSARDLMLASALNTDYLLTLPIYVDWKRASESGAIIFRRGYGTERQKGFLIGEKLDYLQSKLLQGIFNLVAKPLRNVGIWLNEALRSMNKKYEAIDWLTEIRLWMKEASFLQQSYSSYEAYIQDDMPGADYLSERDLPIWLAAQKAVTRYEGILSAIGPRGRLLRKLLSWMGLLPSSPKHPFDLGPDNTGSESYLRPIFLPRISLGDIWEPASWKYCGNNFWKMMKTAVSILLSRSVLQEPAFQELILLYLEEVDDIKSGDEGELSSLQLKIYKKIPIPDLTVIFPHKKLSFRIIDAVRLDIATILGLLAYFINYKFEDVLSSPSALLLDVIAASGLLIYITRVVLGYKQTRDRYQLLVNRTLYEKTVASGFGSVHFLLDASEQQQYKEALLAYAVLLKAENHQVSCERSVGDSCEEFMYHVFKEKVEMPVGKAISTLRRLHLVTEITSCGKTILKAVPCAEACNILKQHWNSLLG